ncbi:MAG TPA: M12 family metallo-peptidase [Thermoanaerobaculia bacterium]|nr:M12 family metallo-peptidase [Thermoanaerobaculia bacterium]
MKLTRAVLTGGILLFLAGPVLAAGAGVPSFASLDLARATAATPVGGALRLDSVQVEDTGETAAFALERFQVFADDAQITVHGDGGATTVLPAPKNAYFRGTVEGEAGSRVFLAVLADGTVQGIVARAEDAYLIGGDGDQAKALGTPLVMKRIDPLALKSSRNAGFTCGNEKLPLSHPLQDLVPGSASAPAAANAVASGVPSFTARVAIETDFEFYSLFNNSATATTYVGNLIGYSSTIYSSEINTSLLVQSVSLWTTSNDPWLATDSGCALLEFGNYWNLNHSGDSRTIAHFLSGRSAGGGIAWLSVLCSGPFSAGPSIVGQSSCPGLAASGNYGGGYGYTGNIAGQFNVNNPTVVWDIFAMSHEIGHNFSSPHSHCYNGIGGNANPIDQCYTGECSNGCNCTGPSLPGPAGAGSGTIMSYCHLLSGGVSNITLTFGSNFGFGVAPGREASKMSSFVVSTAAGNPSCLAFTSGSGTIFSDGFEGGNTNAWH